MANVCVNQGHMGSSGGSGASAGAGSSASFTLAATPAATTAASVGTVAVAVTLTPVHGFSGAVTVSLAAPLPVGVTAASTTIAAGATTGTLSVTLAGPACGALALSVQGVSGSLSASAAVGLTVKDDFTVASPPGTVQVLKGGTSGPVALTISGGACVGPVTVAMGTVSGGGVSESVPANAATPSLALNATSAATAGGTATATVSSAGFSHPVTLTYAITMSISGRLIDYLGFDRSTGDITIATNSGSATKTLDPFNGFTAAVGVPYEIDINDGTSNYVYLGLTSANPTLAIAPLAKLEEEVANPLSESPLPATGMAEEVAFVPSTPGVTNRGNWYIKTPADTDHWFTIAGVATGRPAFDWSGPKTITGTLNLLQYNLNSGGQITDYTAFSATAQTFTNATAPAISISASPISKNATSFTMTDVPPTGMGIFERFAYLVYGPHSGVALGVGPAAASGGSYSVVTPNLPVPATMTAVTVATADTSGFGQKNQSWMWTTGHSLTATVTLSPPLPPVLAANSSSTTPCGTNQLCWSGGPPNAVYAIVLGDASASPAPICTVVTNAKSLAVVPTACAEITGHVLGLQVFAYEPYATVDEAVGPSGFLSPSLFVATALVPPLADGMFQSSNIVGYVVP